MNIGVISKASPITIGVEKSNNLVEIGIIESRPSSEISAKNNKEVASVNVDRPQSPIQVTPEVIRMELGVEETTPIQIGASYTGARGITGLDGKSAYKSWLDAGNQGSEYDFLLALKGARGEKGEKGETVIYQVTKEGFLEVWDGLESDTIDATKFNLESMIIRINEGSFVINGSKIKLDTEEQTLDIVFSQLTETVSSKVGQTEVDTSLQDAKTYAETKATEAENASKAYTDALEIGGRNLLLNSNEDVNIQGATWQDFDGLTWEEI